MATKRIPKLMQDKNGTTIKTGDIVVIEDGYFKPSNGRFMVMHSPGDEGWSGLDYSLKRLNKNGTFSKAKGRTQFWPIFVSVSDPVARADAKEHNARFATIEVVAQA